MLMYPTLSFVYFFSAAVFRYQEMYFIGINKLTHKKVELKCLNLKSPSLKVTVHKFISVINLFI